MPEIFVYRHISPEMQIIFEHISVSIPHAVEIACGKPLRLKDPLYRADAQRSKKTLFELIVGHAVLLPAADIIEPVPEFFRDTFFTDIRQQAAGVLNSRPLKNAFYRDMQSHRIDLPENPRIKDAGLPERDPILNAGINKVHLIDGRLMHTLLLEIFTDRGVGTQIVRPDSVM